jgi:hypothetical protein
MSDDPPVEPGPTSARATDPVLVKRARIAAWVQVGKRIGYSLFGIAVVAFFAGFFVGFGGAVTTIVAVTIVVGSLILAPSIVFGYGVRSADRADREGTWGDPPA